MTSSINNTMVFLLLASVAVVIGGLIAVPVLMEAADAANAISEGRNKGKQGEFASGGKRSGKGGGGINM